MNHGISRQFGERFVIMYSFVLRRRIIKGVVVKTRPTLVRGIAIVGRFFNMDGRGRTSGR